MLCSLPELADRQPPSRGPSSHSQMPALPVPGEVIDRLEVVAEIARGGMAAVFAVRRSGPGGFDKILAIVALVLPAGAFNLTRRRFGIR